MGMNYSNALPHGKDNIEKQNSPPPFRAKVTYGSENATASSVISVGHDTTEIEIAAQGGTAVMRWVTTADTQGSVVSAVSGTNFDHVIPTATVRRFVLPIESVGKSPGSIQGVNRAEGLFQRVAIKSVGVASVLLTEY